VRQKCLMSSLARQTDPLTVLRNYEALAKASAALVQTDIPTADLPEMVKLAQLAKGQAIDAVSLVPPLIDPVRPDFSEIHAMVERALAGEPVVDPQESGSGDGTVGNSGSSATAALEGSAPATATAGDGATGSGNDSAPAPAPTGTAAELGLVCQAV